MVIQYKPIGLIHTPFKSLLGMPIQAKAAEGVKGKIIFDKKFLAGLEDLTGFSHIMLIYHFHKSTDFKLTIKPFLDEKSHGVFATRAPKRPNAIGISVVRLTGITENVLEIENIDVLDGTPLLDIKPFIPDFDNFLAEKVGWTKNKTKGLNTKLSDDRFH